MFVSKWTQTTVRPANVRLELHVLKASYEMVHYCTAPRCMNSHDRGYGMTSIPVEALVRQVWIKACGREWYPPRSGRLCEVHFDSADVYRVGSKKIIRKGAIPKFFCSCETSPTEKYVENWAIPVQSALSDHNYASRTRTIEAKRARGKRTFQAISPLRDHNYVIQHGTNEAGPTHAWKRKLRNVRHAPACAINKLPIPLRTLPLAPNQLEPEIQNDNLDNFDKFRIYYTLEIPQHIAYSGQRVFYNICPLRQTQFVDVIG